EFLRQSDHAKIGAISIEYSLHEEIPAHECVTRHSFSKLTQRIRHSHHFFNNRHVTVLAGLLFTEVAIQPFLIWHLLRKFADLLSSGPQSRCDQRMTGCA